jgi:hypothetical protein
MRIVVFGDSNIGGHADDRGGMARALRKWTSENFGVEPIEIVGVQGSSLGEWCGGIGVPGPGRTYGRWQELTKAQRRVANLQRLRDLKADLYIGAFGSNDANKYGGRRNEIFARNVQWVTDYLKSPVVWIDNGVNVQSEARKRPMVNHARKVVRGAYFMHSSTAARQAPYRNAGGRAHPSWTVHYAFLRIAGPSAARWVRAKRLNWAALIGITGGVAGIGWLMTPKGRQTLRKLKGVRQ